MTNKGEISMLTGLFSSVLMLSIMASAVICIILIAKSIWKDKLSAKWHYYIWFLLFIRLVIPFTPQYSLDFGNMVKQTQPELIETVVKNKIETRTKQDIDYNIEVVDSEQALDLGDNKEEYVESDTVNQNSDNSAGTFLEIAAVVWLVGLIVFLIYSVAINISIKWRIKKVLMQGEQDRVTKLIEECRKSMKITKEIPVAYQNFGSAPAIYGVFKPVLLMPPEITKQLNDNELRYVILHELCHYKRKDNVAGLILMLFNIIHWFNPLMWLAGNKIKEDRELVCDRQALEYVSLSEKRNYAMTIVKILELFSQRQFIQSASSIIQGRASNMEWRLKFIKAIKRKSTVLAVGVTVLVILAGMFTVKYINKSVKFPKAAYAVAAAGEKDSAQLRGDIADRNGVKLVERSNGESRYTYGNLASHVIGSVNKESICNMGIEKLMDDRGITLNNITLTVDKDIQQMVENILDKAVNDTQADGAAAIVMNPSTGEVLAMCSNPDFDLNNPDSVPEGLSESEWAVMADTEKVEYLTKTVWRNKAIADSYEPGSTFKAITTAAGLEEGVIAPDSMVDDYTVTVNGYNINCWKPNAHGVESFREAVYNSCNPPFVKIAQNLGIDKFYSYVQRFGFYDLTGIELSGERESQFHKKPTDIDMAVAAFGQRFNITPIQLLSAYCAVANGGNLLEPQIIKEISDSKGNMVEAFEPKVVRRVISENTSRTLREILEGVVSEGTGKNAYVEGYRIAGKTGTSETTIAGKYIASFIGFAPADNPKVACILVIDNPKGDNYTGGVVAAPAAGQIIKQSIDFIGKSN